MIGRIGALIVGVLLIGQFGLTMDGSELDDFQLMYHGHVSFPKATYGASPTRAWRGQGKITLEEYQPLRCQMAEPALIAKGESLATTRLQKRWNPPPRSG